MGGQAVATSCLMLPRDERSYTYLLLILAVADIPELIFYPFQLRNRFLLDHPLFRCLNTSTRSLMHGSSIGESDSFVHLFLSFINCLLCKQKTVHRYLVCIMCFRHSHYPVKYNLFSQPSFYKWINRGLESVCILSKGHTLMYVKFRIH